MVDFFKGFWEYVSNLPWWQGTTVICLVVFIFVVGKFWTKVITWIGEIFTTSLPETVQYRMFWGLSNDALNIQMKDEIRRSFKENGFDEMSGNEFSQYVKNQSKILMSLLKNHFINLYPPNDKKITVPMEKVLEFIDKKESVIEDIIFEMYIEAKRVKKQDNQTLQEIDTKFIEEIQNFIKKKSSNDDCKSCFVILFGKREIAENKKTKIKSLKAQMNFAEQKLSEIHSSFLSFYSENLNKEK